MQLTESILMDTWFSVGARERKELQKNMRKGLRVCTGYVHYCGNSFIGVYMPNIKYYTSNICYLLCQLYTHKALRFYIYFIYIDI